MGSQPRLVTAPQCGGKKLIRPPSNACCRIQLREYQRRCEDALIDVLLKGAPPPVRAGREGRAWGWQTALTDLPVVMKPAELSGRVTSCGLPPTQAPSPIP